jgi:hypothetical protein
MHAMLNVSASFDMNEGVRHQSASAPGDPETTSG